MIASIKDSGTGSISVVAPQLEQEWMDLKGLTRYAAVSERTLREWIHRGTKPLPAVQVGTKILVRRNAFDALLESHRLTPADSIDVMAAVDEIMSGLVGD